MQDDGVCVLWLVRQWLSLNVAVVPLSPFSLLPLFHLQSPNASLPFLYSPLYYVLHKLLRRKTPDSVLLTSKEILFNVHNHFSEFLISSNEKPEIALIQTFTSRLCPLFLDQNRVRCQ